MNLDKNNLQIIAQLLLQQRLKEKREETNKRYTKIKDILLLIAVCGTAIIAPNSLRVFKPLLDTQEKFDWKAFNYSYLRQNLKRLEKQKLILIKDYGDEISAELTEAGQNKLLSTAIEELDIQKPKIWDRRWRLVMYDIENRKKNLQSSIRKTLYNLGFIPYQESVYLYPYPCQQQIEMIKSYYQLDKEVKLVVASFIENENAFKEYFNLS